MRRLVVKACATVDKARSNETRSNKAKSTEARSKTCFL